ncbi:MAG: outer membrane beta-barrel protein, partial [Mucilaginibacter sp.]
MNKFLILFAALLCAYQFSNAQTEKGNQTLGFYVGLQYNQSTDNYFDNTSIGFTTSKVKTANFNLGPLYSYFIADNLDLGATIMLSSYSTTTSYPTVAGSNQNHNNSYTALVFLRKYYLYAGKIGIRTGPYAGYIWANQGYDYPAAQATNSYSSDGHAYLVGGKVEAVYFPSKHFGVSALLANLNF